MPHLLIIEPDRLLSANLDKYLSRAGYSVAVHASPQAALDAADQLQPDLIIAELQLAGRSGVEFLYEFRSYPDWEAVPVIIFTNLRPAQIDTFKNVFKDLNISACLYKPESTLSGLLGEVRTVLPAHAKI